MSKVTVFYTLKEEYRTATSCDGSTKSEKYLYVDFSKINRPCTCIVTALFVGRITVVSWGVQRSKCKNSVTVNNKVTFNCTDTKHSTFDVRINDSVLLVADFWQGNTSGEFIQCLGVGNHGKCIQISSKTIHHEDKQVFVCNCLYRYILTGIYTKQKYPKQY